jgi:hypothetical protein
MSHNTYWLDVTEDRLLWRQGRKIIVGDPYEESCKIVDVMGTFQVRPNGYSSGYQIKQLRVITIEENTDHE